MFRTRRRVVSIAAAILAAVSVCSAIVGVRACHAWSAWQQDVPMRMPVDLSRPGEYRAAWNQTCSTAHSTVLSLESDADFQGEKDVRQRLAGLRGVLRMTQGPKSIAQEPLDAGTFRAREIHPADAPRSVAVELTLPHFPPGFYEVSLRIDEPAPAMADFKQQLVGRYLLCGLEGRPALILFAVSLLTGVVALLIVCVLRFYRTRPRTCPRPETPSPQA